MRLKSVIKVQQGHPRQARAEQRGSLAGPPLARSRAGAAARACARTRTRIARMPRACRRLTAPHLCGYEFDREPQQRRKQQHVVQEPLHMLRTVLGVVSMISAPEATARCGASWARAACCRHIDRWGPAAFASEPGPPAAAGLPSQTPSHAAAAPPRAHQHRDEVGYQIQRAERVSQRQPRQDFGRPGRAGVVDGVI